MSKKGYRLLLVFSVVMLLIAVAIDIAFPGLIPDVYYEAQEYHEASRTDGADTAFLIMGPQCRLYPSSDSRNSDHNQSKCSCNRLASASNSEL